MKINLKKFMSQKEGETIYSFLFRATLIPNIAISLVLAVLIQLLSTSTDPLIFIMYFFIQIIFILVVAGIIGGFMSSRLSSLYQKYQIDSELFMKQDKITLIKRILKFPKKLSTASFIAFFSAGVIATVIMDYMLYLTAYYFIFVWFCLSLFPAITMMTISQRLCSKKAEEMISSHFKDEYFSAYLDGKHYAGLSLNSQFLLYVILPFVSTAAILCTSFFHYGFSGNLSTIHTIKLSIAFIMDITLSILPALFFINKIKNSNARLQSMIKFLESKKGGETVFIPVDYFSELSYTAENINKISNKYAASYQKHKQTQQKVIETVGNIKESFTELEGCLTNQIDLVRRIKDKIEETKNITKSVDDHVSENHKIALQTMEHVSFGLESVSQNITKMDEITEANEFSVSGIRALSNEINSIWEIVNLISGIADRTKIIAFNAELEVANFESENTSFKNVAANIRFLANQIMDLTKKIRLQIQTIQNSSYDLIKQGDAFSNHIQEGNNLASNLETIYKNIRSIAEESISSSADITSKIKAQVQKRERLLLEIQKTESILSKLKKETDGNKEIVAEIYRQTQIKQL